MSAPARRGRQSLAPALAAALALHASLFTLVALLAQRPDVLPSGAATPITIVASAPVTDSRPAEVAPQVQAAAVEAPVAAAPPPEPPPPKPAPPKPPTPVARPAAPKPVPKPAAVKPAPKAAPFAAPATAVKPDAKPRPSLDLDALATSISRAAKSAPPKPAMARQGPTRSETALLARIAAGQGVSQSDAQGLQQLLERLWNVNCAAEGGDTVVVPVRFSVGEDGRVVGRITGGGEESSSDPVVYAAARRAIDAVHQAEPYGAPYRGKSFRVNFDARKACASR